MSKAKPTAKKKEPAPPPPDSQVSFYPAWCKGCGNCVAFCPRQALAKDQWGNPYLAKPERCTACGLCEMLCPDFAISVAEQDAPQAAVAAAHHKAGTPAAGSKLATSPERLAPAPREEDK